MSSIYYQWRIECLTELIDKYVILDSVDGQPTKCPGEDHLSPSTHTIGNVVIIKTISNNTVTIVEESISTGGHFREFSVELVCPPNTTTTKNVHMPFSISALTMKFKSEEIHRNDILEVFVGKDIPTGSIIANVSPTDLTYDPTRLYSVNSVIKFTHPDPDFGARVYTLVSTAPAGTSPINPIGLTNAPFWRNGFPILVSANVMKFIAIGYYVKLKNIITQQQDNLGMVLYVDKIASRIYVEKNPTISSTVYLYNNPALTGNQPITYVLQTIQVMQNHIMGPPSSNDVGSSKIGSSAIPPNVKVSICYTNTDLVGEPKKLVGRVEMLY